MMSSETLAELQRLKTQLENYQKEQPAPIAISMQLRTHAMLKRYLPGFLESFGGLPIYIWNQPDPWTAYFCEMSFLLYFRQFADQGDRLPPELRAKYQTDGDRPLDWAVVLKVWGQEP